MIFNDTDLLLINNKGLTTVKVSKQINTFKNGIPFLNLKSAATYNDGILNYPSKEREEFIKLYESKKDTISIVKFVPASGAATRMFKFLFEALSQYNNQEESINSFINKHNSNDLKLFKIGLEKMPFYNQVIKEATNYFPNFKESSNDQQLVYIIHTLLDEDKLNFSKSPKGLLPFHKYNEDIVTAFEEHLYEASRYASSNNKANLHFTVSKQHLDGFKSEFEKKEAFVSDKMNTKFNITYSFQKQNTDTIAVTTDNTPFRDDSKNLMFRPGGHGALIENLNDIDADVIFIKNIDNVTTSKYKDIVTYNKKYIAGILLQIQEKAFNYIQLLNESSINHDSLIEIAEFLKRELNVMISHEFEKYSEKYQVEYLIEQLNKPIRICGMVKNEGEPGGGPFWVYNSNGTVSLQIVESAQIDLNNPNQAKINSQATHFNPVDIVCGVKDYKGNKFDLTNFIDHNTGFITTKTNGSHTIKALELPGLWNGSMAKWNSIFVEVPIETFNPVKTVNDLLKDEHQVKNV